MKTIVVNKRDSSYDVYIGRGSIFGNEWTHLKLSGTKAKFQCATREESIANYKRDFYQRLENDPNFKLEVEKLRGKSLGCFCKPLACHGDIIAEYLNA